MLWVAGGGIGWDAMLRPRLLRLGLAAALLALAGQLAWAASVPQPVLDLLAFGPICHSDSDGKAPGRTDKHVPLRAVSPQCLALALPLPPLAAPPALPAPRVAVRRSVARLPPATAPPALFLLAAAPRGPPPLASVPAV